MNNTGLRNRPKSQLLLGISGDTSQTIIGCQSSIGAGHAPAATNHVSGWRCMLKNGGKERAENSNH